MYKHPGNISKIFKKTISYISKDINSLVHCQHLDTHTWTKVNVDGRHERFSWSWILKKKTKLYKIKTMHICFSSIKNLSHELTNFQFEVQILIFCFFCFRKKNTFFNSRLRSRNGGAGVWPFLLEREPKWDFL